MKRIRLIILVCFLLLSITITACNSGGTEPSGGSQKSGKAVQLTILTAAAREKDANIIRDLLVKNGFDVTLNIQPDFASVKAIRDSGEWDIAVSAWNIVSGNPDYAMRPLFRSDSSSNSSGLNDPKLDEMIDAAAKKQFPEAWELYAALERYMVEEHAYIVPLYGRTLNQAVHNDVLDPKTATLQKTRSGGLLQHYRYVDKTHNDTRTLNLTTVDKPVSYWVLRENDTYSALFNENAYVTLINLNNDGVLNTDTALSYNFAQNDDSTDFYFILRDNINFAKVENKKAVDTGVMVSAEDVVFSLNYARDKDIVPDQRVFDLFSDIDNVSIVTSLEELDEEITVNNQKTTIKDVLSKGLPAAINSLTEDSQKVDNKRGAYQVVKITTKQSSPQILYYLSHQGAGVFSKKAVEEYMSHIDLTSYDPSVDVLYGDVSAITDGPNYNNMLWASGPYIPLYQNEFEGVLERNPGYMPGDDNAPTIKTVSIKFINNYDTAVSSFRSGEIDLISWIPESYISILENDSEITFTMIKQNNAGFITFNLHEKDKRPVLSENVRKAILYSIDQQAFIDFYDGRRVNAYSPIAMLYDNPNTIVQANPEKVKELIKNYWQE